MKIFVNRELMLLNKFYKIKKLLKFAVIITYCSLELKIGI